MTPTQKLLAAIRRYKDLKELNKMPLRDRNMLMIRGMKYVNSVAAHWNLTEEEAILAVIHLDLLETNE